MDDIFLIRPIKPNDDSDLLELVQGSSGGLSSLQPRLDFLRDYIASAGKSFSGQMPLETPHKYLMGMVHVESGKLVGCAAVKTCVGVDAPFINFDLKGDAPEQYLEASSRFLGSTEVGSLFLHRDFRTGGLGGYLARARYLLMAAEPWRFGDTVIAELRGICGKSGSPLYDYLFKDKLEKTFLEADSEYFDRNPDALGDVVPIGRIAAGSLPLDVRASIAQPHASGRAAMRLLQNEGFIFSGTIDLFDAGPIMAAYRDTIRTIMHSRTGRLGEGAGGTKSMIVSAGKVENFRAVICLGDNGERGVSLTPKAIEALGAQPGEPVRYWHKDINLIKHCEPTGSKAAA